MLSPALYFGFSRLSIASAAFGSWLGAGAIVTWARDIVVIIFSIESITVKRPIAEFLFWRFKFALFWFIRFG